MGLKDSVPQTLLAQAMIYNFSLEEKNRRELAIQNKDFYYSRQEKYVSVVNTDMDPFVVNITKPIIKKKVSLLYNRPLLRSFDGPTKSVAFLEAFYSIFDIDGFLQNVDLASELTGTGLVFVGVNEGGAPYLKCYDASEFSAVANFDDSIGNLEALSVISTGYDVTTTPGVPQAEPQVKMTLNTQVWTKDHIVYYADGKRITVSPNELGFLPFVAFKAEDVYNQFLGHAPCTPIAGMNRQINQMLTNMSYMIKMQSATPVVLSGFQNGEGVVIHPGKAISLPAGGGAAALQLSPKIGEVLTTIQYLEETVYNTSSVPRISVVGDATSQSGRELMIKWAPLLEVFKDKALRYNKYELNLANMILNVMGMENINKVDVSYPEESVLPVGPEGAELQQEISLGLSTPIDAMLLKQPNMTEIEAEALVLANKQFNESFFGVPKEQAASQEEPVKQ